MSTHLVCEECRVVVLDPAKVLCVPSAKRAAIAPGSARRGIGKFKSTSAQRIQRLLKAFYMSLTPYPGLTPAFSSIALFS